MAQNFNCRRFRIQKSVLFKSHRMYVSILSLEKRQKPERLASLLRSAALVFLLFEIFFWICFIIVHILRSVKNISGPTNFLHKWQKKFTKVSILVRLCYFNSWKLVSIVMTPRPFVRTGLSLRKDSKIKPYLLGKCWFTM